MPRSWRRRVCRRAAQDKTANINVIEIQMETGRGFGFGMRRIQYAVGLARARHLDRTSDLLCLFGAVTRSRLLATLDGLRVQYAADTRVSHARQVVRAAAADQHYRVFLKIVSLSRNVGNRFTTIGQAHLCDLPQRGIRLPRRCGIDARQHTASLRIGFKVGGANLLADLLSRPADELVDSRHFNSKMERVSSSAALRCQRDQRHRATSGIKVPPLATGRRTLRFIL